MESPVVLDKPSEYSNTPNNERGFPFDEDDTSGAWSQLAARHPDIAARLRQRPQNWARKRRPNGQEDPEDFGDFFNEIPPEFREHLAPHFNRRYGPEYQEAFGQQQPQQQQQFQQQPQQQPQQQNYQQQQQYQQPQQQYQQPQQQYQQPPQQYPQQQQQQQYQQPQQQYQQPQQQEYQQQQQYQQQQPQYQQVPPTEKQTSSTQTDPVLEQTVPGRAMSAPPPERGASPAGAEGNVRHIPIFVEGRDIPVVHRAPPAPAAASPHSAPHAQPHIDREQYFADDGPTFHHPNFSRAFGSPFNKGFRQGPQPFTQQKAYPQAAFTRGQSPQRSHSPPDDHYVKVPVHHEPTRHSPQPPHQHPQQQQQRPQQQQPPPQQSPPPPQPKPQIQPIDPITQILAVQTEVLNLMTEVENFKGSKKDKQYIFLDEMLTRNLIKLDTVETEGKENIRQARKEAIKCIQKCIAVLEAKADKNTVQQDVDMNSQSESPKAENGEVEMKETKEDALPEVTENKDQIQDANQGSSTEQTQGNEPSETTEASADKKLEVEGKHEKEEKKPSPKKKVIKKRDKSKEQKEKQENKSESMTVDDKGDKTPQSMEVDSTTTSQ